MNDNEVGDVQLRPWGEGDFSLLQRLLGDPGMTEHLGGPESLDKLRERHQRYCSENATNIARIFVIITDGIPAGFIAYWEKDWNNELMWETGWSVLPEFQGRGIAPKAALLVADRARAEGTYSFLHAFPGVDNAPSNAVCRKAGFTLLGASDFEYPPGRVMRCNNWQLELFA